MTPNIILENSESLPPPNTSMKVADFFRGHNLFITGSTGFLGKILVEKLLWSCDGIENIYLLLRARKGRSVNDRINDLIQLPLFDRLRQRDPNIFKKLIPIEGDVAELNLGIKENDRKILENTISIIFHVASSVRFDDLLKKAILLNVRGTRDILELAKNMKKLQVMLYVSTTYSNTDKKVVEEKVYKSDISWRDMIKIAETWDDVTLNILTNKILDERPNTYTLTKFLAENAVEEYSKTLPCVIFRPSIVTSVIKEPIPGWIDNLNGPVGLITGIVTGILHVMQGDQNAKCDFIPCDFVIKGMIVTAWYKGISRINGCTVINGANGGKHDITYGYLWENRHILDSLPADKMLWYPSYIFTKNKYIYFILTVLTHVIPALIVDALQPIHGSKYRLMRLYRKIYITNEAVYYFSIREWKFITKKYDSIQKFLTPEDKIEFDYNLHNISIEDYVHHGTFGLKKFILNDDISDDGINAARRRFKIYYCLHQGLLIIGAILITYFGYQAVLCFMKNKL